MNDSLVYILTSLVLHGVINLLYVKTISLWHGSFALKSPLQYVTFLKMAAWLVLGNKLCITNKFPIYKLLFLHWSITTSSWNVYVVTKIKVDSRCMVSYCHWRDILPYISHSVTGALCAESCNNVVLRELYKIYVSCFTRIHPHIPLTVIYEGYTWYIQE
jgi:hypothetical protein